MIGGVKKFSANNLDLSNEEKSPQVNNSMLAKRGKIIKNIEIPKVNTNNGPVAGEIPNA